MLKRAFSKALDQLTAEIRYQQALFRNLTETGIQQVLNSLTKKTETGTQQVKTPTD